MAFFPLCLCVFTGPSYQDTSHTGLSAHPTTPELTPSLPTSLERFKKQTWARIKKAAQRIPRALGGKKARRQFHREGKRRGSGRAGSGTRRPRPLPHRGVACEAPLRPSRHPKVELREAVSASPSSHAGHPRGLREAGDSRGPPVCPPGLRSLARRRPTLPAPSLDIFFFFLPNLQTGNSLGHTNTREQRPRPLARAHSRGSLLHSGAGEAPPATSAGSAGATRPAAGAASDAPERRPRPVPDSADCPQMRKLKLREIEGFTWTWLLQALQTSIDCPELQEKEAQILQVAH
nr:uncharacterized protein LOC106824693 [Equus asinus]